MKLGIKPYKSQTGQKYYVISDWYWYHCGLYSTLEQAEADVVKILEEEKKRRKLNLNTTEVYYELCDDEIVRHRNE